MRLYLPIDSLVPSGRTDAQVHGRSDVRVGWRPVRALVSVSGPRGERWTRRLAGPPNPPTIPPRWSSRGKRKHCRRSGATCRDADPATSQNTRLDANSFPLKSRSCPPPVGGDRASVVVLAESSPSAVCDQSNSWTINYPRGRALNVVRARPGSAISRRNSFQPWPFRVTRLGRAAGARTARFPLLPLSPHPPLSPSSWYPLS